MDQTNNHPQLARRLGLFDATMIVMGGIIGSGIFMNPSVVALQVHTPFLILGAWVLGGLFALAAAFIWGELAAMRPDVGGQYAYLREAFHPGVAFLYGWVLPLVCRTDFPANSNIVTRRARSCNTDNHQLPRRARRQHRAKHPDGFEDTRDRDAGRLRIHIRKSQHEPRGTSGSTSI